MEPVAFSVFGLEIRWYGILMALGFATGYFLLVWLGGKKGLKKELIEEYAVYLILSIIVGARLFHCLVYAPIYYFSNLAEILYVWKGGLASHGGIIGGVIVTWIFCRIKGLKFYELADLVVIPAALGAVFVRIGNFMNGELVGKATTLPWGVYFKEYEILRHPSQIYEAVKNFVIFLVLISLHNKKLKKGTLFWGFILLFSFFRFFVEFFKDMEVYYGLTIGQWASILFGAVSIVFLIRIARS